LIKIIYFNGEINTDYTKELYDKLTQIENKNIILLDNFISLFDEQNKVRLQYLSLIYQFIKCFSNTYPKIKFYLLKEKLVNEDIEQINKIITNDIYKYFKSFFDLNYNNLFIKRITDCSKDITKQINTEEMLRRMLSLCKIFGLKTLHKLNIEIISVSEFWDYNYLDRVKYFRLFYNRCNSLFKLYYKYYEMLLDIDNRLLLLVKIDPLDHIEDLEDSTSSFILSDDNISIFSNNDADFIINKTDHDDIDTPFAILSNNKTDDDIDTPFAILSNNKTDDIDDIDTPFVVFSNDKIDDEIDDNVDTPFIVLPNTHLVKEYSSEEDSSEEDSSEEDSSDEDSSEDSDDQIYDFFVKE